jgi:hypothetical protein
MMNTFCLDSQNDLDDGICMPLFAVREAFQESLCFIPFQLVFGQSMGVPCKRPYYHNIYDCLSKMFSSYLLMSRTIFPEFLETPGDMH